MIQLNSLQQSTIFPVRFRYIQMLHRFTKNHRNSKVFFLILLILSITNCTIQKVENQFSENPIYISNTVSASDCRKKDFKEWHILYGLFPILPITDTDIFSTPNQSYSIQRYWDGWDLTINLILASTLSITRDTVAVQACSAPEGFIVSKKLVDDNLSTYKSELSQKNKTRLKEELNSLESQNRIAQKINQIENDYYKNRTDEVNREWLKYFSEENDPSLYTLIYHDGKKIQGKLVELGKEHVIFEMRGSRMAVPRKEIQKLVYPGAN
jgi:hypothetical protein